MKIAKAYLHIEFQNSNLQEPCME